MDQRERSGDFTEALRTAMDGRQAKMWTALPGIIQSFNRGKMTAVVQTTVQAKQALSDGTINLVTLPLCLDCPVQFPSGGGVTLTFPVAEGDECLVVFASRAIDGWWQSSGVQPPIEARMHDLSDGFVLLGFRSVPRVLGNISAVQAELRSDDGSTIVGLNPTAQTVSITAPGGAAIKANAIITGTLLVTGMVELGGPGGAFVQTTSGPSTMVKAL